MPQDAEILPFLKIEKAFKEWAVITDALGRGKQSIILRKGGIQEESRTFRVDCRHFFLFPTFEHQNAEDLKPEIRPLLAEIQRHPPAGVIPIQYFAVLDESFRVDNLELVKKLRAHHVWSDEAVEKRFDWGKEKSLFILLVRIYRLPHSLSVPARESYGGCKSWVTLEDEIPLQGAVPVLKESEFLAVRDAVRGVLAGTRS